MVRTRRSTPDSVLPRPLKMRSGLRLQVWATVSIGGCRESSPVGIVSDAEIDGPPQSAVPFRAAANPEFDHSAARWEPDQPSFGTNALIIVCVVSGAGALLALFAFADIIGMLLGGASLLSFCLIGRKLHPSIAPTASVAAFVLSGLVASSFRSEMAGDRACSLKTFEFENDSVVHLGTSWWPPSVQCRYGFTQFESAVDESHTRWLLYSPVVVAVVAGLLLAVGLAARRSESASTAA